MNTPKPHRLETRRLRLRQWEASDYSAFAELNRDPVAMEFFPSPLSREESDAIASKCQALIAEKGWGFWAASLLSSNEFIGFIGLHELADDIPCSPCVEIGWRLRKEYWGNGYATEGAIEALNFAFNTLQLQEVVAFTAIHNQRSRAVMKNLGMTNSHQNFVHPKLDPKHPLSEHVLYKIQGEDYFRHSPD